MNEKLDYIRQLQIEIPGCCNTQRYLELMAKQVDCFLDHFDEFEWTSKDAIDALRIVFNQRDRLLLIHETHTGASFTTAHYIRRRIFTLKLKVVNTLKQAGGRFED